MTENTTYNPEAPKPKKKMGTKTKVALGAVALLAVGGVAGAATNGNSEKTTETVQEQPKPEPTVNPAPEEVAQELETKTEGSDKTTGEVVPDPKPYETVTPDTEPQNPSMDENEVFAGIARQEFPVLAESTTESIATVGIDTCLDLYAGVPLMDQVTEAASTPGLTDEQLIAGIGVMLGGIEFYCPEYSAEIDKIGELP